jgi:hypothetical protein
MWVWELTGSALSAEEYNTRGTLVSGLSYQDIKALDIFEGSVSLRYAPPKADSRMKLTWQEYARRRVVVQTLTRATSAHGLPSSPRGRAGEALDMEESKKAVMSSDTRTLLPLLIALIHLD